ncbi:MAG: hypothetical protein AAF221_00150 [Pseudomonadota bacterium]
MTFFDIGFLIAFVCGSTVFCVIGFRQVFSDIEAWHLAREPQPVEGTMRNDLVTASIKRYALTR